jgi:hypothetical protein
MSLVYLSCGLCRAGSEIQVHGTRGQRYLSLSNASSVPGTLSFLCSRSWLVTRSQGLSTIHILLSLLGESEAQQATNSPPKDGLHKPARFAHLGTRVGLSLSSQMCAGEQTGETCQAVKQIPAPGAAQEPTAACQGPVQAQHRPLSQPPMEGVSTPAEKH